MEAGVDVHGPGLRIDYYYTRGGLREDFVRVYGGQRCVRDGRPAYVLSVA